MAGAFFGGLFQTIGGGIATAATLGLNQDVLDWTAEGANRVADNAEKAWGKDGEITKFVEGVPVVGYVASAGHGIAAAVTGDEEDLQRARRACAASTKSGLVATGATVGILGGPAGIAAGAGLGSMAGQCAEKGINHANDKEFQTSAGTFHDFHAGHFIGEAAFDVALAGIGANMPNVAGNAAARKVVGPSLKEVGGGGIQRNIVKNVVKKSIPNPATKVAGHAMKKAYNPRAPRD
eukprot:gene17396-19138_t